MEMFDYIIIIRRESFENFNKAIRAAHIGCGHDEVLDFLPSNPVSYHQWWSKPVINCMITDPIGLHLDRYRTAGFSFEAVRLVRLFTISRLVL